MEILNVTYKCKEGMREEFLEAILAEGLDEASRAEAGNIKYDFYLAFDDPDELDAAYEKKIEDEKSPLIKVEMTKSDLILIGDVSYNQSFIPKYEKYSNYNLIKNL